MDNFGSLVLMRTKSSIEDLFERTEFERPPKTLKQESTSDLGLEKESASGKLKSSASCSPHVHT